MATPTTSPSDLTIAKIADGADSTVHARAAAAGVEPIAILPTGDAETNKVTLLIDTNLFSGSSDSLRGSLGGYFENTIDTHYATSDISFTSAPIGVPKNNLLYMVETYSGDDIILPPLHYSASSDTIIPSNYFVCTVHGDPHEIDDDKMWKILWAGGTIDDTTYEPILNQSTYSDFYTQINTPYPRIDYQHLQNPDNIEDYIEISYDYNAFSASYQQYASTLSSELLIPNGHMLKLAQMHATAESDLLGWQYNALSVNNQIPEPWTVYDTAESASAYISDTTVLSSLSSSTQELVKTKMKNIFFNDATFEDYDEYNEAIKKYAPYYTKIKFNTEDTGFLSQTQIHGYYNWDTRLLRLLKETFLEQTPEEIQPHTIQFVRHQKWLSASTDTSENVERKASANIPIRAVGYTSLLLYSYDKIKCEQEDFTIIDQKNLQTNSTYDADGIYRHINTKATIGVLDFSVTRMNLMAIEDIYSILNVQQVTDSTRPFGSFRSPALKYNETIAYRIEKRGGLAGQAQGTIQNFWFFNSNTISELEFLDTQVNYDRDYTYVVYAYVYVYGTKYRYSDLQLSRVIGQAAAPTSTSTEPADETGLEKEEVEYCIEFYDPATDQTVTDLVDSTVYGASATISTLATEAQRITISKKDPSARPYIANFLATVEPSSRILEIPLFQKTVRIQDHPPNRLNILPSFTMDNSNLISFDAAYESFYARPYPTTINAGDRGRKSRYLNANDILSDTDITLPSVSKAAFIDIYRIDQRPTSFESFNGHLVSSIDLNLYDLDATYHGTLFYDKVKSNKKYYYLFRARNQLGIPGQVDEIMEAELINDGGYNYALFNTIFEQDLDQNDFIQITQPAKKLFQLTPSIQQSALNSVDADFNADAFSQLENVTVGVAEDSLWGKTFKIRLTSKKTNKKIDLNITYNQDSEVQT